MCWSIHSLWPLNVCNRMNIWLFHIVFKNAESAFLYIHYIVTDLIRAYYYFTHEKALWAYSIHRNGVYAANFLWLHLDFSNALSLSFYLYWLRPVNNSSMPSPCYLKDASNATLVTPSTAHRYPEDLITHRYIWITLSTGVTAVITPLHRE